MTKFSLHGDHDEGGPSCRCPFKRSRDYLSDSDDEAPVPPFVPLEPVNLDIHGNTDDDHLIEEEDDHDDGDEEEYEEVTGSPLEIRSVPTNSEPVADKSISVCFTDPDVLDCIICFEPLTIPVYQCENGHIACSSCCSKIHNKCPSCSWPIGYNRCRAIEKVLESVKIACQYKQYGCQETMIFSKKKDHEKNCSHSPCSCPLTDCNFVSSYRQLYSHFRTNHSKSALQFFYNIPFNVELKPNVKSFILQEQGEGVLFILNRNSESYGDVVWLSCMSLPPTVNSFEYSFCASHGGNTLSLRSNPKSTQRKFCSILPTGFLLIPSGFFGLLSDLYLRLCIFDLMPECSERDHNED